MEDKTKKITTKKLVVSLTALFVVCGLAIGLIAFARNYIQEVATKENYGYINPDETKAETDAGFVIDGVFDEEEYQKNQWLYLQNKEGGSDVDVVMTSYFGEKGMYFAYDVTERTPIFVNTNRSSYLNSCIEMYLAPSSVTSTKQNSVFEIDLLPTGDMTFKMGNGKGGYTNVAATDDIMACLGATTKGGDVNTKECTGYNLELFIPWDYMDELGLDVADMKENFVYVNPAHITSFNQDGTSSTVDRYWYSFAQQQGAGTGLNNVFQYFRFNGNGAIGTVPVTLTAGEHYTISGMKSVIPGMKANIVIAPEKGYALNSIIVNGEEYLDKASYNEDGTVMLDIRAKEEGIQVSAVAEAVSEGNKTLSGTISVNKLNGDSLNDISVSYSGPTGEKPITLDGKGAFVLTDLAQGYYSITVEKKGYQSITRGIYLNRDVDTNLVLEYGMFECQSGTGWILDGQNSGTLTRFGGAGTILSVDSYEKFTAEVTLKYDKKLAEEYDHDYFRQQRQGLRIQFSNEKIWDIDLVKNLKNEDYVIQYAKFSSDNSLFDWKQRYTLSKEQVAQYCSKDGIKLEVQRDGKYVNIYLNDKLVANEILDDEYTKHTAKVGFEYWAANRKIVEVPYKITNNTSVNLKNTMFMTAYGWDLTNQYNGLISMPKGGKGTVTFIKDYANMDLTLRARDYAGDANPNVHPRTDVLFVFENGAHVSFGVSAYTNTKTGVTSYRVQSINNAADDGKQIYNRNKVWGNLTKEEVSKYLKDGVDFRIVRIGTEASLYIGDRFVAVADLTNNKSGVSASMKATISIRHYDDKEVQVDIPFSMTEKIDGVTVKSAESKLGKVATNKKNYFLGDTVILSGDAKEGYYMTSLKINGTDVPLKWDGTYTFITIQKNYTVEGTFAKEVFRSNKKWNLLQQNQAYVEENDIITANGIVALPTGGSAFGDDGSLEFYQKYANMDLTLKVTDYNDEANQVARTDVLFVFENGAHVSFGVSGYKGNYRIQSVNLVPDDGKQIHTRNFVWGPLTEEETRLYLSEGVNLRIVRYGTDVYLYIGSRLVNVANLTSNNSGVTENMKATVSIRHYDDAGVEVVVPFTITNAVNKVDGTMSLSHASLKTSTFEFAHTITDMDFKLNVRRHTEITNNWDEKIDVLLEFENGANVSFYLSQKSNAYRIMNLNLNNDKDIYARDTQWYTLTDDEKTKYFDAEQGLDLRIVRSGTDVLLYINNQRVVTADLTNNDSGVTENTKMKVTVRHYSDQTGSLVIDVPFEMTTDLDKVQVIANSNEKGTVTTERTTYMVGDSITLLTAGRNNYYCQSVVVNGAQAPVEADGTYTFVASKKNYDISAVFAEGIFNYTSSWDLREQNNGVVKLPNGGTNSTLQFAKQYANMDLTLKVTDYNDEANQVARTDVLFVFENGAHVSFGVSGYKGNYRIQSVNLVPDDGKQIHTRNFVWGPLTEEETRLYLSEGVNLRIVRYGTDVYLYIGSRLVNVANLTNNGSGVTASMKATVSIRHYDDAGVEIVVPFTITNAVNKVDGTMSLSHASLKTSTFEFAHTVTDMNLNLHVRRYTEIKNNWDEKIDVLLEFENGANVSFYLSQKSNAYRIMNLNLNNGKDIYARDAQWYTLTDDEKTKYFDAEQGLDFRVVRSGTDVLLYINSQHVVTADLTNNNSGVTEKTKMKVTVRHYSDNTGSLVVDIPFEMTTGTQVPATTPLLKSNSILWFKKKLAI